jgi:uncharacterized membrane protein HdeD (DUF308 family)
MNKSIIQSAKNAIRFWYVPLLAGCLFIGAGIWVMSTPVESFIGLAVLLSIFLLVAGIAETIFSIVNRKDLDNWGWTLVFGLINIFIGLQLVGHPLLSAEFLAFYIGFAVLFRAIGGIGASFDLKKSGDAGWGALMFLSLLGIIVSFILIRNPALGGLTVGIWAGFALISGGITSIYYSLKLRQLHKLSGKIAEKIG